MFNCSQSALKVQDYYAYVIVNKLSFCVCMLKAVFNFLKAVFNTYNLVFANILMLQDFRGSQVNIIEKTETLFFFIYKI